MRVVLAGFGSIGRRHARNLLALGNSEIVIYDVRPDRLADFDNDSRLETTVDLDTALDSSPDLLLVCTPTSQHINHALKAARRGIAIFVEKPLSYNTDGVDELLAVASANDVPILVACNFRFDSGFVLVQQALTQGAIGRPISARAQFGQYLPEWHPDGDYRQSYSANQSLGGGAILDSVHELDYVTWLLGSPTAISCAAGRLSDLQVDTEDVAEIMLHLESGVVASVHMDYVRRVYDRSLEVVGTGGVLQWRFQDNFVGCYDASSGNWVTLSESKAHNYNAMYMAEMQHILDVADRRAVPCQDGHRGKQVVEMALLAKKSAAVGRLIPFSY